MSRGVRRSISILTWLILAFVYRPPLGLAQTLPEIKAPTPGASLEATRVAANPVRRFTTFPASDEEMAFYRLRATGFPKKEKLYLWIWDPASPSQKPIALPVMVDGSGGVYSFGKRFDNFSGVAAQVNPAGRSTLVMLTTEDGKIRALVKLIPRPLEAKKGSCRVRAEISEAYGAAHDVAAQGFPPQEDLKITLSWAKESREISSKVRDDGSWSGQVKLHDTNQESFKARLTLATGSCTVSLPLERRNPKTN